MCGIIGYTGAKDTVKILLDGLETLEYRGYDSAGIALYTSSGIRTIKSKGKLAVLAEKLKDFGKINSACGIGHTRWATHGEPSDRNSHPHFTENLALVHNGIIENYAEIAAVLEANGYSFLSETDTEVAAKLIDMLYLKYKNPLKAIFEATEIIRGSYAFGIVFADIPDTIYSIRKDSPLIVAKSEDGGIIASDIPAILAHTKEYYRLEEGIIAKITKDEIRFYKNDFSEVGQKTEKIDWDVEQAQKGGYPHFMIKEIHEEPEAVKKTLAPRIRDGLPFFDVEALDTDFINRFEAIHVVACGTAMHAGLVGKTIIEKLARVPVTVEIASEFRYRDPILGKNDLVILLSQSGETADTLAALRHAKKNGVYTLAIVNVMGSSVAREADSVIYTWAGPEIAVASTKAYTVQCALLYLFAVRLAIAKGKMSTESAKQLCEEMLNEIPRSIEAALKLEEQIMNCAKSFVTAEHLFFIGRGIDYSIAVESSLKLKEISYIHSEAYAAGELKHGTISLITEGIPVIAITTESNICEKTVSGIREVKARGAHVLSICTESLSKQYNIPCDEMLVVPDTREELELFPAATILQLFAYSVSYAKGLNVDKPRNLAKSVTVE